jgi:hypothetical protein
MNNLLNQKFNHWTILYRNGSYMKRDAIWHCKCDCGVEKDVRGFHLTKGYSTQCRNCADKSSSEKRKKRFDTDKISLSFWNRNVVYGAKKRSLVIEITMDEAYEVFLKQNGKCALSGLPLQFPSCKKDINCTASLDRIDSSKGYIKGNFQWVHKDINVMKNNHTQEYFLKLCKMITEYK